MAGEILLVEDSPADVEFTLRALRVHSLADKVVVVRDGAEALDVMLGQPGDGSNEGRLSPRLVLLDLKLPKVDGIEVLRRIKSDERTRRIPVVVLTSSAEETDVARAYDLGVNSYIVKPVAGEDFADAVMALGRYWYSQNRVPHAL